MKADEPTSDPPLRQMWLVLARAPGLEGEKSARRPYGGTNTQNVSESRDTTPGDCLLEIIKADIQGNCVLLHAVLFCSFSHDPYRGYNNTNFIT